MTGAVLADATWPEVADRTDAVLVVPLGAHDGRTETSEQHGRDLLAAAVADLSAVLGEWSP